MARPEFVNLTSTRNAVLDSRAPTLLEKTFGLRTVGALPMWAGWVRENAASVQ
jgi:hypothetical protein